MVHSLYRRALWALLSLTLGSALAYQGGALKNHNHSSTAGDGGQLSGVVIASTSTVGGLNVSGELTLNGSTRGITFPDATRQTTAASAPSVFSSSCTMNPIPNPAVANAGASGPSINGSTLTYTIANANDKLHFEFGGSMYADTGAYRCWLGVILDGNFILGQSSTRGLAHTYNASGGESYGGTAVMVGKTAALSAGSHAMSIIIWTEGGGGVTCNLPPANSWCIREETP